MSLRCMLTRQIVDCQMYGYYLVRAHGNSMSVSERKRHTEGEKEERVQNR